MFHLKYLRFFKQKIVFLVNNLRHWNTQDRIYESVLEKKHKNDPCHFCDK